MFNLLLFLFIGVVVFVVGIIVCCITADFVENTLPKKLNEIDANGKIEQFEQSPAAQFAVSHIVDGMVTEIYLAKRPKTLKTIIVEYSFSVNEHEISIARSDEYVEYFSNSWSYDFCQHRYPNLTDASDRTALALTIRHQALEQLKSKIKQDPSGSYDIKFTYSEPGIYHRYYTLCTIYYTATNNYYEEYKSW